MGESYNEQEQSGEYHEHRHKKRRRRKRKNKALQIVIIFLICVAILVAMGAVTLAIVSHMGNENLKKQATSTAPKLEFSEIVTEISTEQSTEQETEEEDVLEEGQIYYKGQKYQYNEDIRTFVIMGIDYKGTVAELLEETMGGQSDMNFMAVLNPHEKSIELIAINRNTMTQIQRFSTDGTFVDIVDGQITLQHAYGSGGADSCEMMVSAIDNVMYMVPIHGYFAMNMGAISMLNDAVGGVELVAMEDVVKENTNIRKGDKVLLLGEDAFWYTKYRDYLIPGTADARLERQKQYINAFMQKMKQMIKEDISLPIDLYHIVEEYSVTDLTISEMTYLASQAASYSFDLGNIHTVPGETVENGLYEEYYVDEEGLYEIIVDVFYEPVYRLGEE